MLSFENVDDLLLLSRWRSEAASPPPPSAFYEDRGLIRSERAGSGHRRYPRAVLRRIAFIVFAQRIGLTLGEIGVGSPSFPRTGRRTAPTGPASPPAGARGSTSGSPSSSGSRRG